MPLCRSSRKIEYWSTRLQLRRARREGGRFSENRTDFIVQHDVPSPAIWGALPLHQETRCRLRVCRDRLRAVLTMGILRMWRRRKAVGRRTRSNKMLDHGRDFDVPTLVGFQGCCINQSSSYEDEGRLDAMTVVADMHTKYVHGGSLQPWSDTPVA